MATALTAPPAPDLGAIGGAPAPVAPAPAGENDMLLSFKISGYEPDINVDINDIPVPVRLYLIKTQIKSYVANRVTTAASSVKTANAKFDEYEAAQANNPLQQVVAKPEGERATVDYGAVIGGALKALKENAIGRRGTGERKAKERKDPLIAQITRAVVSEIFQKNSATNKDYKYPHALQEVGADGLAYLRAKAAEKVAAGLATAEQMDYVLETRYIKPARIMLGMDASPKLAAAPGII